MRRDADTVVIVGASVAGLSVAEGLRRAGFERRVVLVGDESHPPYDRPPLSKQYLAGTWGEDHLELRDEKALEALEIDLRLEARAAAVDERRTRVILDNGLELGYDRLVAATGVGAKLPARWRGTDGIFTLRTRDDARRLREALDRARSVVVVGAGFIGSEVAATCSGLGLRTTLVDPLRTPMIRVVGAVIGEMLADVHREHGVDVRCGVGVDCVLNDDRGRIQGVRLEDHSVVAADVVVVGVGSVPNVEWLRDSGVRLGNGVDCDERCRAGNGIYGAGDVASWLDGAGRRVRVEHRLHAAEHGQFVAQAIVADDDVDAFAPTPFFWSDQYTARIQSYGVPSPGASIRIVEGAIAEGRLVAAYAHEGRIVGVLGINMPKQARLASRLIGSPAAEVCASTRSAA